MGLFPQKANFAERVAFGTIRAVESPNAIFVVYVMFATIVTGGFVMGVFQNVF